MLQKIKQSTAYFLAFALAFSMLLPVKAEASGPQEGDTLSFQILFTSDTHGSFTDFNYATGKEIPGGVSRIATVIKQERDAFNGTTFIIDVGDTIQGNGTTMFLNNDDYQPFPVLDAFNVIGYDMATLGNHEFNFGVETMYHAYTGFRGSKLLANVTYKEDGRYLDGFEPYRIVEFHEGLRVAFIGVVTPNIDLWDAGNMENDGLEAVSASVVTREIIDQLQDEGLADIFVLVAHMGDYSEYGREGSGAVDVAEANPELAVILGAHYHTMVGVKDKQVTLGDSGVKFAENKNAGGSVGKVIITATYEDGAWVIKDKSGENYETAGVKTDVIEMTTDIPKDPAVEEAIKQADKAAREYVNGTVVGTLVGGPLVPESEVEGLYQGYFQDTAISDLINNAMMHFTDAEISGTALMDTLANHEPGEITVGGVAQIYKYDNNTLYKLSMTGEQIVKWMEWSHEFFGSTINGVSDPTKPAVDPSTDLTIPIGTKQGYNFDQFAGIIYEVDLTKPSGERVNVISMADGSPFELDKEYTVAVNDYRANTQLLTTSENGVFKPGEETATLIAADIQASNGMTSMQEIIIEYIQLQPKQTITNDCDNNWWIKDISWDSELRAQAIEAINEGVIETDFKEPITKDQIRALR